MSNLNPEQQYQTIPEVLDFAIGQRMKDYYFCLPALVVAFDATTRRITAKVALRQILADSKVEYALLHDVPVLYPCSTQYLIYFPLTSSDTVLLHFSQRGIEAFKKTYVLSDPSSTSLLSFTDAVAVPSFGNLTQPVVDEDALTLQTSDGQNYITLKANQIVAKVDNAVIEVKPEEISLTATTINLNGQVNCSSSLATQSLSISGLDLPADHTHGGISTGTDNTLPPNP